jgi:HD-like signal output (HDOD) protein
MKTVSIAHQFLAKPCEANQLEQVVRRACDLSQILNNDELQSMVGGIAKLPSAPQTYVELNTLLGSGNASLQDVARVIEKDVAMCAKLLQLVNSAFFGLPRRITSAFEAASYLGTLMIRNLAVSMGAFSTFENPDPEITAASEKLRHHSILTAHLARLMFKDKRRAEDAFMAGMLHEIGHLILLACPGAADRPSIRPALLGAYLLGLWGIPYPVVEAVAHFDDPVALEHAEFELPDAVYIAHALAAEHLAVPGQDLSPGGELNVAYLERLGISAAQVASWRESAREMAHDGNA